MTTKPPSPVQPAPENALERIAYASVKDIPTVDPHDRDRLGYNVWRWLKFRKDPLDLAVRTAGARMLVGEAEALEKIRASLREQGIDL
jgi:hypothetical protein